METAVGLLAGLIVAALGVALILEARVAVRARLATEERLRLALAATTDVIWDWDVGSDGLYCPGFAEAYGFTREESPTSAAGFLPFVSPQDAPALAALLAEAVDGRRDTLECEHRIRSAAGGWRWALARARVVARDRHGRATRVVGSCTDVTERRRILDRLNAAERLASLGTLAAGVAHEINNPLSYVLGSAQHALESLRALQGDLLEARWAPGEAARTLAASAAALDDAVHGAERVRDIVRDLKVFSRAGVDEHRPVRVDRIIRSAANLAGPEIRRRARLRLELAEGPTVDANESRLSQVFLNLLVNAAQAIPEGRPAENEVAVSSRVDGAGRLVVEVRDTGCGIPPGEQKRIFDPFFTTKPVGVGTGLGLAICHGIVTAAGGEIEVESAQGLGSTFRVLLPVSELPEEAAPTPVVRGAPRRARVLVVDDEEAFCRAADRMLRDEHDVVTTSDPLDALRRVESGEPFDLLLTDVVMPQLSGLQLHARIAESAPELALRTLFVTGGAVDPRTAEILIARRGRVLEKPCGAAALREAVAGLLSDPPPGDRPDRGADGRTPER